MDISNFLALNHEVLNILGETHAYLAQLNFIGSVGQNHPSRNLVLRSFAKILARNPFVLSDEKLLGSNGFVINYVNKLINQKVPDVLPLVKSYQ